MIYVVNGSRNEKGSVRMKYANKLSDKELRELYTLFTDSDAKIYSLDITKDEYTISLDGQIEIPEWEPEYLKEDPNATLIVDDSYEIDDYYVKVYDHSGSCTTIYREWMHKKFGDQYAVDFLLPDHENNN